MDETQREFLIEIEELVEYLFNDLEKLRAVSDGPSKREQRATIDRLFRRVHSVKGSAASCGLESITQVAHELENVLARARNGRINFNEDLIDAFAAGLTALGESVSFAAAGAPEPSRAILLQQLREVAGDTENGAAAETETTAFGNVPSEIWQALDEPQRFRLMSAIQEGSSIFEIVTSFELGDFDEQFVRLKERLAECGEVVTSSPSVSEKHPEKITFRVLFAGHESIADLEAALAGFAEVQLALVSAGERESSQSTTPAVATVASLSNFIRTDLEKLDRLISSTHELFRTTSAALELALSGDAAAPVTQSELKNLSEKIRSRFLSVEDELINLRMVSLEPTFQRAARAGKEAARLAGREIDFEILGGELRIDKLLADAIADPLVHLVRNAVDHGIEISEQRAAVGKSLRGAIRIEALSEGSQTRVRVTDDGRGIDPALIAAAAARLGLGAAGVAPDIERIDIDRGLRLIFRPGFTTRASVSEISGRGVGLDVVETAVEQVGGELRVATELGHGTTFEIRLPVTFGLVATNVVVSDGHQYCIPVAQTLGIDAIEVIDGASGANQLRQVSMRDLLGQPEESEDPSSQLHLITCQFAVERPGLSEPELRCLGIVVDRVEGPQEVLVRNLGRHAGRWYGIAGATELRDGTVALVLDLPRLLNTSK